MSSIAGSEPLALASGGARIEAWFRRLLWICTVVAALGVVCHLGLVLWSQEEFTTPESIVATQSLQLARHGTLYYDLTGYPYTVCAYTPQFYFLEAGLNKIGLRTALAGRLISFTAMLGLLVMVWKLLILYTENRLYAWTGCLLCGSTALILSWGTIGQVDTLAVFWSVAAFYQYSRYSMRGEATLSWAGCCALIAFFTKQTAIAAPVAIFLLLWVTRRKTAILFGSMLGGAVLALVLLINLALGGRFLLNILFANMNELSWEKLGPHVNYLLIAAAQLAIIAIAGFKRALRERKAAPYVYLAVAFLVLALTAPKIGSDSNYQIETTVALVLCAVIALHALDFFRLCFTGSRSWITLLQVSLALHLVENYRITARVLQTRIVKERMMETQVASLGPYTAGGGRLLSMDYNAMAQLRGFMEVEPLIYHLLVRARVVDPEPLRRDLAAEAFSTIFLYEDVEHPANFDLEVSSLPPVQIEEIRKHYRVVAHVPGPYLNGIFVYQPVSVTARPAKVK